MILERSIDQFITVGILDLGLFAQEKQLAGKRVIEQQGTKHLLKNLLKTDKYELNYTQHKKPYLAGRTEFISISHSHDRLAIILNTKEETGIDIELVRDKVKTIRHKFLNDEEDEFAGESVEKLLCMWGAKEALYKVHGLKQLDFRTNIEIEPFNGCAMYGNIISGKTIKRYRLVNELMENYILVYILNEI